MSLPDRRRRRWAVCTAAAWVSMTLAGGVLLAASGPFPDPRPATRTEAVSFLASTQLAFGDGSCALPRVLVLPDRSSTAKSGAAFDRAVGLLERQPALPGERTWSGPGVAIRYTVEDTALDRASPTDTDHDGTPDIVQSLAGGLLDARTVLVDELGLPTPGPLEVSLRELGNALDAYVVASAERRPTTLVLDATPCEGVEGTRQAAMAAYARAVALELGPAFPRAWAEALAQWVRLDLDGATDPALAKLLTDRLHHLDAGLFTEQPRLAAGNAAWLSYVDHAWGRPTLVATIEELASGDVPAALGRALERTAGTDLASAFRDFHVWSLLTGSRDDGYHFPFAGSLGDPRFASENEGLPALSIQADPPVAPWGAAQIRLEPDGGKGGLSVHFDGEFPARWQADLVLLDDDGTMRRLPLEVSDGARAVATVPLDGLAEAFLLVRRLGGGGDATPKRYNYSAHREPAYPFEITVLEATEETEPGGGILVSWETSSEHGVIGYDVLRVREAGGREIAVNPVWVPALGDEGAAASYHYLDASALPGVPYVYRIRATTTMGLTSLSDPVLVRRPDHTDR